MTHPLAARRSARPSMLLAFHPTWTSLLALLLCACASPKAASPPTIPVGLDAYRQWERWPYQRIGCRAYMRSTYDRAGSRN